MQLFLFTWISSVFLNDLVPFKFFVKKKKFKEKKTNIHFFYLLYIIEKINVINNKNL
jgi:hypothetical protein